ncbi:MAG TPA: hypothetical protein VND45_04770 [Thermoanaerobaculia bacterium]|jgi:hypothetical protein|nr:hypothetical protein [Thermoanaerobaculia bacterium]
MEYSAFPLQSSCAVNSKKILLTAIVCLIATPLFAQLSDTYVITGSANLPGSNNTRWLTQLSIFNPHLDHALNVSITLLPTGGATGPEKLIKVPANSTFITDNVMKDVFNLSGSGSLLLATFASDNPGVEDRVISRAFLVNSNTYNDAANGTFGQTVAGVWTGLLDVDTDDITAVAHGIDNSSRLGFRTNVGAVNLGACSVTMFVTAYDADGRRVLNAAPFGIPPYAHMQQRLPVTLEGGSVEFSVQDPCAGDDDAYAVVVPYTSTIDDLSGDPRYQQPTLLALAGTIYGKKAVAANADPTTLGKKIDNAYAQKVVAKANRLGAVNLVQSARGWVVE